MRKCLGRIVTAWLQIAFTFLASPTQAGPGAVDLSFDPGSGISGVVYQMAVQPDGKILIAGEFPTVPGLVRAGIARLNPDGSGDASFKEITGAYPVSAIAVQPDGKILIGGSFTTVNGLSRNRIARLNADGTLDTEFHPGTGADWDIITAVTLHPNGMVIIAGSFATVNGIVRNRIARLHADGALDLAFDAPTETRSGKFLSVSCVALQHDGKVIIGGAFALGDNTPRNQFVRLSADGSVDDTFHPPLGAGDWHYPALVALQPDGNVLISDGNGIARLRGDGSRDTHFNPAIAARANELITAVALQSDGKVVIGMSAIKTSIDTGGGAGTNLIGANTISGSRVIRLHSDGSLDVTFNSHSEIDDWISSLALQPDGKVLVGGQFTTLNGTTRNRIARLLVDGTLDGHFNSGSGINGWVNALALQGDRKVIIVGEFTTVQGVRRQRVARLNEDGNLDSGFDLGDGPDGEVSSLALRPDGKLLIGGHFTAVNGAQRFRLARLHADGTLDLGFDPRLGRNGPPAIYAVRGGGWRTNDTPSWISSVALQPDGKAIIGGVFTAVAEVSRYGIARLHPEGSVDTSFDPGMGPGMGADDGIRSIALQPDGKVVIGGAFTTMNRTGRNRVARLHADGSLDTGFDPGAGADSTVFSVALQSDGKVLIAGWFKRFDHSKRSGIARLHADGSLDDSFRPGSGADGMVQIVAVQRDESVLIGGPFGMVNGFLRNGIARLRSNGDLDPNFSLSTGWVTSIALQPDDRVLIGGGFRSVDKAARWGVARLWGDRPPLTITPNRSQLVISWPSTWFGFSLQSTPDLDSPWTDLVEPIVAIGGNDSVTLPSSAVARQYFRIRKP